MKLANMPPRDDLRLMFKHSVDKTLVLLSQAVAQIDFSEKQLKLRVCWGFYTIFCLPRDVLTLLVENLSFWGVWPEPISL